MISLDFGRGTWYPPVTYKLPGVTFIDASLSPTDVLLGEEGPHLMDWDVKAESQLTYWAVCSQPGFLFRRLVTV